MPWGPHISVCRAIGLAFVAAALAAVTYEVMDSVKAGSWQIVTLRDIWLWLHMPSHGFARSAVERHLSPWLWHTVIATALLCPGWLAFGAPGGSLVWLCRRRKRYFEKRLG